MPKKKKVVKKPPPKKKEAPKPVRKSKEGPLEWYKRLKTWMDTRDTKYVPPKPASKKPETKTEREQRIADRKATEKDFGVERGWGTIKPKPKPKPKKPKPKPKKPKKPKPKPKKPPKKKKKK